MDESPRKKDSFLHKVSMNDNLPSIIKRILQMNNTTGIQPGLYGL